MHISHYGRICPIETPEGTNIGLISSLGDLRRRRRVRLPDDARTASSRTARSPTRSSTCAPTRRSARCSRRPTRCVDDERQARRRARARPRATATSCEVEPDEVQYVDVSPQADRRRLGRADPVPRARRRQPRADGLEHAAPGGAAARDRAAAASARAWRRPVAHELGHGRRAPSTAGTVDATSTPTRIVDRRRRRVRAAQVRGPQRAHLPEPAPDRQGRARRSRRARSSPTARRRSSGELALGKNVLVAFMPWDGYNFEDAILVIRAPRARTTPSPRSTSTSSRSRSARPSSAARSSRATSRTSREKALAQPRRERASSASARASSPATSSSARSPRRARAS